MKDKITVTIGYPRMVLFHIFALIVSFVLMINVPNFDHFILTILMIWAFATSVIVNLIAALENINLEE